LSPAVADSALIIFGVALGPLYGAGDFDRTMEVTMRVGHRGSEGLWGKCDLAPGSHPVRVV